MAGLNMVHLVGGGGDIVCDDCLPDALQDREGAVVSHARIDSPNEECGWCGATQEKPTLMERQAITKQRSPWERAPDRDVERLLEIQGARELSLWQRRVHDGHLSAMVALEPLGRSGRHEWHMSISHRTNHHPPRPGRYPTWDEIAHARYELLPEDKTFVMFLPPPSDYVALHDTTFHLHEYIDEETNRA